MAAKPAAKSSPSLPARRFRWKPGVGILCLGGLLLTAAWKYFAGDRTYQIFSTWAAVPGTMLSLLIWWTFFSGLTWRGRMTGIGVVVFGAVVFGSVARVIGFTGDLVPILAWRWQATPAEQARRYWEGKAVAEVTQPENSAPPFGLTPALPTLDAVEHPDWPDFRGSQRDGVVRHVSLRKDWNAQPPRLMWRHPVGPAWSSFTVEGQRVFTQEQRDDAETVVCYDFATGEPIWSHSEQAKFHEPPSGIGPRATPTLYDGRVYALGATGILTCLDLETGKPIWSRSIIEDNGAKLREWGVSGSPLVYDEVVVVNPGGPGGKGLVAYNRRTGDPAWSAGNSPASFSSPQLAVLDGQRQILIFDGDGLAGYDALRGSELWRFEWRNTQRINVAQPLVLDDERIYIGTGYGKGSAVVRVSFGEVAWSCDPIWTSRELKPKFNGVVVHDDYLYGLDEGILVCLDARTGERKWKHGRYRYGQMLLVGDTLLIQSESGEMVLVEASPEGHREFCRFQALEGTCWNEPVLCQNRLLARSNAEAVCYELKTKDEAEKPNAAAGKSEKVPPPEE